MNKDIVDKIDEIIKEITDSSLYKEYLNLKEKLDNNPEIKEMINKVKVLQKDVIHKIEREETLQTLLSKLNEEPLYREYSNVVADLNNLFSIIENSINNYFEKILN